MTQWNTVTQPMKNDLERQERSRTQLKRSWPFCFQHQPMDQQKKDEPIPSKYMRWIIECFIDTLQEIKEAIVSMPNLQLIGSSLLFVYEGDRAAAEKTWKYMLDEDRQKGKGKQTDEEEDDNLAPKMCDLRLIDFAHSDWHSEREEHDPDLVKGFDNIIDILYQCLKIQHQEKL